MLSRTLSEVTGATVYVKFENLQFTAAYKERGARQQVAADGRGDARSGRDRRSAATTPSVAITAAAWRAGDDRDAAADARPSRSCRPKPWCARPSARELFDEAYARAREMEARKV
jgi:threonine dehydratase